MGQSKVVGFIRFYGRRLIRGWARVRRAASAMWKAHEKRTWWQRSLVGVVAAGMVAGIGLALFSNLGGPPRSGGALDGLPQQGASLSAGGAGDAAPAGNPVEGLGALDAAMLPPAPAGTPASLQNAPLLDSPLGVPSPSAGDSSGGPMTAGSAGAGSASSGGSGDGTGETTSSGTQGAAGPAGQAAQAPTTQGSGRAPAPFDVPAASVSAMEWPVAGTILRPYGWYRHPVFGDWRHASSVVLAPAPGERIVTSALAGRVSEVVNTGETWRVTIRHADGWETEYDGLASVEVASYQVVQTGQAIGRLPDGTGGQVAFAVYRDGVAVDPSELLGEPVSAVSQ